ncbi:MAG: hypothetical protein AB7S81_01390 [Bdellovibrionales bacterium]
MKLMKKPIRTLFSLAVAAACVLQGCTGQKSAQPVGANGPMVPLPPPADAPLDPDKPNMYYVRSGNDIKDGYFACRPDGSYGYGISPNGDTTVWMAEADAALLATRVKGQRALVAVQDYEGYMPLVAGVWKNGLLVYGAHEIDKLNNMLEAPPSDEAQAQAYNAGRQMMARAQEAADAVKALQQQCSALVIRVDKMRATGELPKGQGAIVEKDGKKASIGVRGFSQDLPDKPPSQWSGLFRNLFGLKK